MHRDESESQVWCKDCNVYLWSVSRVEEYLGQTHHKSEVILTNCPCKKDNSGKCTGAYR